MARITVRETNGTREVTVSGRLVGSEVRRLEHACGPALERAQIGLPVHAEEDLLQASFRILF